MRQYVRNEGFLTAGQQAKLWTSRIGIAGAGGDGGHLAVSLARLGVGRFRIADPETFAEENLNRQDGCFHDTIGVNKAEAIAGLIERVNPLIEVDVLPTGVSVENAGDFVRGCDIVSDETEYTHPGIGVAIAQASRREGVPVVMGLNIGFGTAVTSILPDHETFESYLGLASDISPDDADSTAIDLWRWAPKIPHYMAASVLEGVTAGTIPAPSVSPGVDLCTGVLAVEVLAHLVRLREPVIAPECFWFDAVSLSCELIRDRRESFFESLHRR